MKVTVIIVAAGSSKRLPAKKRKPYIKLGKEAIVVHTIKKFTGFNFVNNIILVANKRDLKTAYNLAKGLKVKKNIKVVTGGRTREDSVYQGLLSISWPADYIAVHDAVRPFFLKGSLKKLIDAASRCGASILAIPVTPTIKEADENLFIRKTPERKKLWQAQTPQVFKSGLLMKAYKRAYKFKEEATDDASLVEKIGVKVKIIKGCKNNIKITDKNDLALARILLKSRSKR